jgi:hypothetical protein
LRKNNPLLTGGAKGFPDDPDQKPLEAAECFGARLAFGPLLGEVGAGARMNARLGQGDSVEGGIQLPVAVAIEALALGLA